MRDARPVWVWTLLVRWCLADLSERRLRLAVGREIAERHNAVDGAVVDDENRADVRLAHLACGVDGRGISGERHGIFRHHILNGLRHGFSSPSVVSACRRLLFIPYPG